MTELQQKKYADRVFKWICKCYPNLVEISISWRYEKANSGSIAPQPEYASAHININLDACTTKEKIAATVIHEFCHVPTWPLYMIALDLRTTKAEKKAVKRANETATTVLEKMFLHFWWQHERD